VDWDLCSEIEIFHMVLDGKLIRYPNGFWQPPNGIVYATNILRHLIEDILKWDDKEILDKFDAKIFREYKLNGMLSGVYNSSPFEAIDSVYPNKFVRWQFNLPRGFWENDDNIIEAVKDVYNNILGVNRVEDIYNIKNHRDIFIKYRLNNIVKVRKVSTHEVIKMAYSDLDEEKFYRSSQSFYDLDKQVDLLREKIKEKKLTHEDIVKMTADSLKEYNLYSVFIIRNCMTIYDVIELVFPNEFKPWEFSKISNGFWKDKSNIRDAVKWLIEEKLKFNPPCIIRISKQDFYDNGLNSLAIYSDMNHIGLKNIIKMVYDDCDIIFKTTRDYTK